MALVVRLAEAVGAKGTGFIEPARQAFVDGFTSAENARTRQIIVAGVVAMNVLVVLVSAFRHLRVVVLQQPLEPLFQHPRGVVGIASVGE